MSSIPATCNAYLDDRRCVGRKRGESHSVGIGDFLFCRCVGNCLLWLADTDERAFWRLVVDLRVGFCLLWLAGTDERVFWRLLVDLAVGNCLLWLAGTDERVFWRLPVDLLTASQQPRRITRRSTQSDTDRIDIRATIPCVYSVRFIAAENATYLDVRDTLRILCARDGKNEKLPFDYNTLLPLDITHNREPSSPFGASSYGDSSCKENHVHMS